MDLSGPDRAWLFFFTTPCSSPESAFLVFADLVRGHIFRQNSLFATTGSFLAHFDQNSYFCLSDSPVCVFFVVANPRKVKKVRCQFSSRSWISHFLHCMGQSDRQSMFNQVQPGPIRSIRANLVQSGPVRSNQVQSGQRKSNQAQSGPIRKNQVDSIQAQSVGPD